MTTIQKPIPPVLIEDLGMLYFNETSKQKRHYAVYQCECGKEFRAMIDNIKRGRIVSCGCYLRQRLVETNTTHGLKNHNLYGVWEGMVKRTTNPNTPAFKNYGGRGIFVCDEWRNDFKIFYDDMISTYQCGLFIDRIDNDKGYSLENCRWATRTVQARNTRKLKSTNTSGYRGVSWSKGGKKWVAQISINAKRKYLGSFATPLAAARAYDRFVIENGLEHTLNKA